MKRHLLLLISVLVLTFSTAVFLCVAYPPSRINLSIYQQIEKGMTRQQVEKILGGPPPKNVGITFYETKDGVAPIFRGPLSIWVGPDFLILVAFDADDRVSQTRFEMPPVSSTQNRSILEIIRSWLPC